jgi:hypothetical protein
MKTRARSVALAVALLGMGCDPAGAISFYDKEVGTLESTESIGRVGDVDLVVRVRFSYMYLDAPDKARLSPEDSFHGGVHLEETGAEQTRCATTSVGKVENEWRLRCEMSWRSFDDESSWRAAYGSVEIESCAEGSRAAIRGTMEGNAFPSAGWVVLDTTGDDVEWIEFLTEDECTEALVAPWPTRAPKPPRGPDRPDDYKIAPD